eukprot:11597-Heterococcus_DN1.PRE.1
MSDGVQYWDGVGGPFSKGLKNGVPNICIELPDTLCESCKTLLSSKEFASHLVHQATLWQMERVDKAKQQPLKPNASKRGLAFWEQGRVVIVSMMGRGGKLKCLLMHFDFEVNPISLKKWLMQVVTSATARSSVCDCLQLIKYAHKSWTDKDNVNEWGKTQDFFVTKHNVVSCSHYTFNDATPRAMTQSGVVHDIETIDRFYDAISCCNIAAVSGLAQEVPQLLKTRAGRFSCGPMAVAAKVVAPVVAQKLQLLQTLLHCGADVNERSSSSNTTALNHLAHRGDVECVQFLLHEGADACMGSNATPPWLPVHTAIKRNYLQVVELLVQWHCATDRIDGMRSVIRPESDHWKSEHIEALAAVVARYATAAGATGVAASTGSNKRVRSQLINNSSATGAAASAAAAAASVTASAETAAATTAASTLAATG